MKFILSIIHRQAVIEKEMNSKMYKVLLGISNVIRFKATKSIISREIVKNYKEMCSKYSKYSTEFK